MLLGGNNTVVDTRSANEISEAAKRPSPQRIAQTREARAAEQRALIRDRLLNPPMEHVDTVSVLTYSSSSDTKPAG
jgi:hypothetical protein